MREQDTIHRATRRDLDDLVQLEQAAFAADAFSRAQLRYLLTRANATTYMVKEDGRVLGAAIMLWRKGSAVGHLYSIATDPASQGRGMGSWLLQTCEAAAARRGCQAVKLEVRAANRHAIAFYTRHGYRVVEALPGFYADAASGIRMQKDLVIPAADEIRLQVPYYAQTLAFTCGPACLMMAMKYLNPALVVDRSLELVLWKEATLIFMTSGLGGCGPVGLAVAGAQRGYRTRAILSEEKTPFLSSVRSAAKREVIRLVHEQLKAEAQCLDVPIEYGNFTEADIKQALRAGTIPIVLISTYRLHKVKAPHWVVVTGCDRQSVYFHDPYEGFYVGDVAQAQHMSIPIAEFRRMRRYGTDVKKCIVFVACDDDETWDAAP